MYIRVLCPVLLNECLLCLVLCALTCWRKALFIRYDVSLLCLSRQVFKKAPAHFPHFFRCVMESCLSGEQLGLSLKEQTVLLLFLDHCFNSLVRSHASHFLNHDQASLRSVLHHLLCFSSLGGAVALPNRPYYICGF